MPTLTRKAGEDLLLIDDATSEPVARVSFRQRAIVDIETEAGYRFVRAESWSNNPARRQPTGDEADRTD
jgi:hypothetical protein